MITASFCFLKGLGPSAERRLWNAGILSWDDLERSGARYVSDAKFDQIRRLMDEARHALAARWYEFFLERFPPEHRIRIWPHVRKRAVFLDVETDGLGPSATITTIAIVTREAARVFVEGEDLNNCIELLTTADLLVTFNGTRFDLVMLERRFGARLNRPHLDLWPVAHAMGWRGGLKVCERRLGIRRSKSGIQSGVEAIALWERWRRERDATALQLLVSYNAQDACHLEFLASAAYRRSMAAYPLNSLGEGQPCVDL